MPPSIKPACRSASCCRKAQASDKTIAPLLIEQLQPGRDLIADRGYDARALVDLVARRGGRAHIPTCPDRKIQRSVDLALYRQRNLVERFFNKLKHFRRIATRYDKTARTSRLRPARRLSPLDQV